MVPTIFLVLAAMTLSAHAQRQILFAGYTWVVKSSATPVGPGPNFFSDREEDVWVDDQGIHLTVSQRGNRWYSTEVILERALGYGTYIIQTQGRIDRLDSNIVGGLFTWDNTSRDFSHRELDIEYAKWGMVQNPTNAQYAVQPCNQCPGCGRCERFQIELSDEASTVTHFILWSKNQVQFKSFLGDFIDTVPAQAALIHEWDFCSPSVPPPGKENVRFNFWLFQGDAPTDETPEEMVVSGFRFSNESILFDWDIHP